MSSPFGWYEDLLTPGLESELSKIAKAGRPYRYVVEAGGDDLKVYLVQHLKPLIRSAMEGLTGEQAVAMAGRMVAVLADNTLPWPKWGLSRGILECSKGGAAVRDEPVVLRSVQLPQEDLIMSN